MPAVRPLLVCASLGLAAFLPAFAAPSLTVYPAQVEPDRSAPVEFTITGLTTDEVVLRVWADADGDGFVETGDVLVFERTLVDNGPAGRNFSGDLDPRSDVVEVRLSGFTPGVYPWTTGDYAVQVDDGVATPDTASFRVTDGSGSRVLQGEVRDAANVPVSGALVRLEPLSEECGGPIASGLTDRWGTYSFFIPSSATSPCGRYVALAYAPGHVTDRTHGVAVLLDGGSVTANLRVAAEGVAVTGAVQETTGAATVGGALVVADSGNRRAVAYAGANGAFSFTLPRGDWALATDPGRMAALDRLAAWQPERVTVAETAVGGVVVDAQVPAAWIGGFLEDLYGAGLPGVRIALEAAGTRQAWTVTAGDGSWSLPASPQGNPQTVRLADGRADVAAPIRRLTVTPGTDIENVDLQLLWGAATASGTVRRLDGTGVAGVCIHARTSGNQADGWEAWATTGCDGAWDLPVIGGVTYDVTPGRSSLTAAYLGVSVNGGYQTLDVPVNSPAITGVDFLAGRDPRAMTIVSRDPAVSGYRQQLELRVLGLPAGVTAVADGTTPLPVVVARPDLGRLVLDGSPLGGGPHTVVLTDPATGATATACFAMSTLRSPGTCAFGGIVRDASGTPLAGALVRVGSTGDAFNRAAVTASDGRWSVSMPGIGRRTLLYLPPAGSDAGWHQAASVACGATALDQRLPEAFPVGGIVRDAWGDAVPNASVTATGGTVARTVVADAEGRFRIPAAGATTLTAAPPPAMHLLPSAALDVTVMRPVQVNLPPFAGADLWLGRTADLAGRPLAARVDLGTAAGTMGHVTTDSCTGAFAAGVPRSGAVVTFHAGTDTGAGLQLLEPPAGGDVELPFTVRVPADAPLQLASTEPHILALHLGEAQANQPLLIEAENLGDGTAAVSVLFTAEYGTVAGTGTVADPLRGRVFTRVPAGAVTGPVVLQVGDARSPAVGFTRLAGTFPAGSVPDGGVITESGTGVGVQGAWLLVWQVDSDKMVCGAETPRRIVALGISGADGRVAVNLPPGEVYYQVVPPAGSSRVEMHSGGYITAPGGTDQWTFTLPSPTSVVTLRVVDAVSGAAVPRARIRAGHEVRFTADDGTATVPLFFITVWRIDGPWLSRYRGVQETIPDGPNVGDRPLARNAFVEVRALTSIGTPLVAPAVTTNDHPVAQSGAGAGDGVLLGSLVPGGPQRLVVSPREENLDRLEWRETVTSDVAHLAPQTIVPAGILRGHLRHADRTPVGWGSIDVHVGSATSNDVRSATACDDGAYRVRLPANVPLYLHLNPWGSRAGWADAWYGGGYCPETASWLSIFAGVTNQQELLLERGGPVSGSIVADPGEYLGGTVRLANGALGSCVRTVITGGDGLFTFPGVPVGSGYRASATIYGHGEQCWDGHDGCSTFTPFAVTTAGRSGIDFDFGVLVREIGRVLLRRSGPYQVLTFAKDDRATTYNVYTGGFYGDHSPAPNTGETCRLTPPALTDNGDGTFSYTMALPAGNAAYTLVSGSNAREEGTLGFTPGQGWTLCGPTP